MTVGDWFVAGLILIAGASTAVILWWIARGLREGHEAGPVVEQAKGERDEAIRQAEDLAAAPLSHDEQLRALRRLRDRLRRR